MTKKNEVINKDNKVDYASPEAAINPVTSTPDVSEQKKSEYPFATFTCELPSQGKIYPKGHPLHKKTKVELKYMTAREEDILTSPQLLRNGKAIEQVVQSCLVDHVLVKDIITGDRNAILMALRISGYGKEYKVELTSPETGDTFEAEFDLTTCGLKYIEAEPVAPYTNAFQMDLPLSKAKIIFKLLTVGEESQLNAELERIAKATKSDRNITTRLGYQITAVNDNTDPAYIKAFVENMPVADSRAYRTAHTKILPDVDMEQWVHDPTSGEEVRVDIPIGPSFLWPQGD